MEAALFAAGGLLLWRRAVRGGRPAVMEAALFAAGGLLLTLKRYKK